MDSPRLSASDPATLFSGLARRIFFRISARGRMVCAVLGLFTGLVSAAEFTAPGRGRSASEAFAGRDWQIAVQARRALFEDPTLAPLNLGVSVRQRTATLWGPVPSAAVGAWAVDRLRLVPGVAEVRSELYIEAAGDFPWSPPRKPAPEVVPSRRSIPSALPLLVGRPAPGPGPSGESGRKGSESEGRVLPPPFQPQPATRGPGAILLAPEPLRQEDKRAKP